MSLGTELAAANAQLPGGFSADVELAANAHDGDVGKTAQMTSTEHLGRAANAFRMLSSSMAAYLSPDDVEIINSMAGGAAGIMPLPPPPALPDIASGMPSIVIRREALDAAVAEAAAKADAAERSVETIVAEIDASERDHALRLEALVALRAAAYAAMTSSGARYSARVWPASIDTLFGNVDALAAASSDLVAALDAARSHSPAARLEAICAALAAAAAPIARAYGEYLVDAHARIKLLRLLSASEANDPTLRDGLAALVSAGRADDAWAASGRFAPLASLPLEALISSVAQRPGKYNVLMTTVLATLDAVEPETKAKLDLRSMNIRAAASAAGELAASTQAEPPEISSGIQANDPGGLSVAMLDAARLFRVYAADMKSLRKAAEKHSKWRLVGRGKASRSAAALNAIYGSAETARRLTSLVIARLAAASLNPGAYNVLQVDAVYGDAPLTCVLFSTHLIFTFPLANDAAQALPQAAPAFVFDLADPSFAITPVDGHADRLAVSDSALGAFTLFFPAPRDASILHARCLAFHLFELQLAAVRASRAVAASIAALPPGPAADAVEANIARATLGLTAFADDTEAEDFADAITIALGHSAPLTLPSLLVCPDCGIEAKFCPACGAARPSRSPMP
ncbi:uncharacterized protein AMSG_10608 [Thecamonas trahens ATCC 50062]|uniref:DH domain-containing protein n=1 Tax=Thecamonas trahens ATCC 50062 TaxID=461836 RepID=A0A0L0DSK5_THETB|nr:hypothetical protein AMSG_10608 [Thecamonas trahens ATCC 50062]KNC55016.1 hypothetical protein AMSG_10608 [Thecamonas trahens ATCC 50062]|eukprot:XP_013753327.1 hypothetical protein AMSG_10608 [Thecamonas trahens ATCC 50062]